MQIYQPAEDSHLFQNFLEQYFTNYIEKAESFERSSKAKPQTPNPKPPSKNFQFLDMGTGSGILAKTALKFLPAKNITAIDINPEAVKKLQNQPFKTTHSNLFQSLDKIEQLGRSPETTNHQPPTTNQTIKFDLIVFNAPYLPQDELEPTDSQLATTGGKKGDEISLEFLKQAKAHLNPNGKILLLISSLTPQDKIKKLMPCKIIARKKIFMEDLLILEFQF